MDVTFVGQPFDESATLGATLARWLDEAEKFTACVAWTQTSGLDHIRSSISRLHERGGDAVAIVGIDGGIATSEGLAATLEVFSTVYVFHDVGSRTFHPKLYVASRGAERLVAVGSSNLTEGGLFTNYEASLLVTLRVGKPSDDAFMSQVELYLARLTASGMPVRSLDAGTIEALASRSGVLADEVDRRRRIRVQLAQAERGIRHMFGDPPEGLTRPPRVRRRRAVVASPTAPPTRPRQATVRASWSKTLTVSDAMRKTIGNQRAYVILGKAGHDIDQKTYFRDEFFRGVSWVSQVMRSGNVKEIADVPVEVIVERQKLGDFVVRIDHAENRIADQNNAPTWLHWSSLMDVVRTTDLTGYTLTLELLGDDTFRLRLTS